MPETSHPRRPAPALPVLCAACVLLAGCASDPNPTKGLDESDKIISIRPGPSADATVVARVEGADLTWNDLSRDFAEIAGGRVIEEAALDRLLRRRLLEAGLSISNEDIDRERRMLVDALRAESDEQTAGELFVRLRARQGLGEHRFRALLERNAMLRKLVAPGVEVDPQEVRRAYDIVHGERLRVRLLTAPTTGQAAGLRHQIRQAEGETRLAFAEAAARHSMHPSSDRGGLISAFSVRDPGIPASIRSAAAELEPGEVSEVVAFDNGFAILYMEERLPASGVAYEDVADRFSREVRIAKERLAMEEYARRLLRSADIQVLDPGAFWSWRNRSGEGR